MSQQTTKLKRRATAKICLLNIDDVYQKSKSVGWVSQEVWGRDLSYKRGSQYFKIKLQERGSEYIGMGSFL